MNRIIGYQRDWVSGDEVPMWSSGRPAMPRRQASTGRQLAEDGEKTAAAHANRLSDGWLDSAMAFLASFARSHGEFSIEEVRRAAAGVVPEPPDNRAWGAVALKASKGADPLIRHVKAGSTGHAGPRSLWRLA